jgi:hypothetical protein
MGSGLLGIGVEVGDQKISTPPREEVLRPAMAE